jgi:hypothetical protein
MHVVNLVALVDWRFIKLHKRQPGERDIPVPAKARPKLDQALNRGGWTGTHNTPRTDTHRYSKAPTGDRRHILGACRRDRQYFTRRIEQYQPARGRHTNRITGCLQGFPLGIPFPPMPQTAERPPNGFSRIPPVWFHDGYRPVIWPFHVGFTAV